MGSARALRRVLWGLVGLSAAGLVALVLWRGMAPDAPSVEKITGPPAIVADFSLTDHTGRRVTDEDYRGRWLLVFFGYTNCPDVCPTTLGTVADVLERLGGDARAIQPLFITIDPERDTAAVLAEYVAAFDPRIVGLTGTPDEIKAAAASFLVYDAKDEPYANTGAYSMAHSARLYLIDPEGNYATSFAFGDSAEIIATGIRRYL